MCYNTIILTLILQFTTSILAAPASSLGTSVTSSAQGLSLDILRANSSSPSGNSTETIPFHIDQTPLTLQITPLLGQKIARNDLIIALYDSREYVRRYLHSHHDSRLQGRDEPFSSTKLPSPPTVSCVVKVQSGKKLKSMTYGFLGDTVQGLMDYTFYPYKSSVNSFEFKVEHEIWGEVGTGSLGAFQPQKDGRVHTQKP